MKTAARTARTTRTTSAVEKTCRVTVCSTLSFDALVAAFEGQLGWWDLEAAQRDIPLGWEVLEKKVSGMAGPHGLMIVSKTDQGEIASVAGQQVQCTLYLVGNPVTATGLLRLDRRASLMVPFRVALHADPRSRGAMIVYDTPSSVLAPLENAAISAVGAALDEKMNAVIEAVFEAVEARDEALIDEALDESFPASDPASPAVGQAQSRQGPARDTLPGPAWVPRP